MTNGYFGKLYASAQAKIRFDFPFRIPFYIEPEITFNRWDFYKSNYLFFEDVKPAYLIQKDQHTFLNLATPLSHKDKLVLGSGIATTTDDYYQTEQFKKEDTTDCTLFNFATSYFLFERNTLNRKQYATQGTLISLKIKYIYGEEYTKPGSTSVLTPTRNIHKWTQYKFVMDKYYKQKGVLRMGIYTEGVYSAQPIFNNYTATILSSPAFQPLIESKTLFQSNFRAHVYFAFGIKNIITFKNKIDFRTEVYYYQPYREIQKTTNNTSEYSKPFLKRYFIGSAALVGHTLIGPISINLNYYHQEKEPFSFLFNFGYIIFNQKSTN